MMILKVLQNPKTITIPTKIIAMLWSLFRLLVDFLFKLLILVMAL